MDATFNRLEAAFKDLIKQDNQDLIRIDRFFSRELCVEVAEIDTSILRFNDVMDSDIVEDGATMPGTFRIYEEASNQMLVVDSPLSGIYRYEWDRERAFWCSSTHSHFMEGHLVREFLQITNGFLQL